MDRHLAFVEMLEELIVFVVGLMHVWFSPFSKVEESFNWQAAHYLLYFSRNLTGYDHHEFPGSVPRTFLCILPVAFLSAPFKTHFSKPTMQIIVRSMLWFLSFLAWRTMKRTIARTFGRDTAVAFSLVTVCQFHMIFYMSRTLPNIFALVFVFLAYTAWMQVHEVCEYADLIFSYIETT